MPATTVPPVPHYEPAPETKEEFDYADVPIIDFSKVHTPEGRAELMPQVRDAMHTYGFMRVVNHGLSQAQNDRIIDIADVPFTQVSEEEQRQLVAKVREGDWKGYKPRQYWHIDNGVRDQIEHYGVIRPAFGQQHPKALQPFLPEVRAFMEFCHFDILHPILRLLALGLELPEETFVNQNHYDAEGMTFFRFMKYYPRTDEDEAQTKNVWLKGHTDSGVLTILWNQPVVSLQIMCPDGKWRYVKYIPNSIIINTGDTIEMLSGGHYKATIHRVVQPPVDQRDHTRLGVIYFAYGDDDVRVVPHKESPLLQRVGIKRKVPDENAPTIKQWRTIRISSYGNSETTKKEDGTEEQVLSGVLVKHFN
ncbi:Clavaminate synthase-like protein [Dichomitus squalens]|uniref:Clavaminate synthase-like protein n=1 Tax=Dichomitus squalens TaxID=114155 RepID=A0A4Q9MEP5_9APHY|nr:Clavaminate synthase-like protein [Dichomitus squalens]TBU47707.1 Clavaminate synthase-like protein [Dichomitus squalens]